MARECSLASPLAQMSGKKYPSDMSPQERREYLRRFPRMAWWLRQVDGSHPDYPGMPQSSQPTPHPESSDWHDSCPWPHSLLALPGSSHPPLLSLSPSPSDLLAHQLGFSQPFTSPSRDTTGRRSQSTPQSQNQSNAHPRSSQALLPLSQCRYMKTHSSQIFHQQTS